MLNIEQIIMSTQKQLIRLLLKQLSAFGYSPIRKPGYIYAEGDIPVLLVAHMDTVHDTVNIICRSENNRYLMSPTGIGGDDRCGIYMLLRIAAKHRCHILFTEDEETGGKGAIAFTKSGICPDVNYIIELDRRGANDAVFYECNNPEFTKFITDFGFKEAHGSFSDISIIAPYLGIAAVNISAGYYNEHSRSEYIDMHVVKQNIARISEVVVSESKRFEYIAYIYRKQGRGQGTPISYDHITLNDTNLRELMDIPDNAYLVLPDNSLATADSYNIMVDYRSHVYIYYDNADIAVELKDCKAKANGMPIKFNINKAVLIDIFDYPQTIEDLGLRIGV